MQQRKSTAEVMAIIKERFPHAGHLLPELEATCKTAKEDYGGQGQVTFDFHGFDVYGQLIVKFFDLWPPRLRFWHEDKAKTRRVG